MAKILEGLRYSESHEYVKIEGDYAVVGITDFAQEQLGNVVYVDVPEVGDEVTAGETFRRKHQGCQRFGMPSFWRGC